MYIMNCRFDTKSAEQKQPRQRKVNGAKVPEGVVCDFYTQVFCYSYHGSELTLRSDEKCREPLWIGMEDPGTCDFGELEIENKSVSVHCYDDTQREEI